MTDEQAKKELTDIALVKANSAYWKYWERNLHVRSDTVEENEYQDIYIQGFEAAVESIFNFLEKLEPGFHPPK